MVMRATGLATGCHGSDEMFVVLQGIGLDKYNA